MLNPPYHSAGSAIIDAAGTTQRRFVRAPQTIRATATGRRNQKGIGTAAQVPSRPAAELRTENHSAQAAGMKTADTAMTPSVAPRAIPSDRHSPRTANQSRPIPGVTFVSSTNAQVAG